MIEAWKTDIGVIIKVSLGYVVVIADEEPYTIFLDQLQWRHIKLWSRYMHFAIDIHPGVARILHPVSLSGTI